MFGEAGPAHSAPRSAFHCRHRSHKDYGSDSCSLAQSFGFTQVEISALQNSQHSNSFIAVSAVSGIFSPMRYERVIAGHKGVNKYISCIWSLLEQKSSPSIPYLMLIFLSLEPLMFLNLCCPKPLVHQCTGTSQICI